MNAGLASGSAVEEADIPNASGALSRRPPTVRGLSQAEARRRLSQRGGAAPMSGSRSYASIIRASLLTVFNLILGSFGVVTLVFGDWRDALFLGILIANTGIGIAQEVRRSGHSTGSPCSSRPAPPCSATVARAACRRPRSSTETWSCSRRGTRWLPTGSSSGRLISGSTSRSSPASLSRCLGPEIRETVPFFRSEGVELKVLSGDNPETAAAIARDVGIDVRAVVDGRTLPEDTAALQQLALNATVIGRISPEGKRAVVEALRDSGRYVAMVGDG